MIAFVLVGGAALMALAVALLRAWVATFLWLWFAVPLGAPPIGVAEAFGLAMLVSLFVGNRPDTEQREPAEALEHFGKILLNVVLSSALSLVIGYFLKGAVG